MIQPAGLQTDLLRCSRETRQWVLSLVGEVERLRAVLPLTKDGVLIVPGMTLWYIHPRNGTTYETGLVGEDLSHGWRNHDGRGGTVWMTYRDCWSTRAAAQAAGGE